VQHFGVGLGSLQPILGNMVLNKEHGKFTSSTKAGRYWQF